MKINVMLVSLLIGSSLLANDSAIKEEKQDKPQVAKGIAKIISGAVAGIAYFCLMPPQRIFRNMQKGCNQLRYSKQIEGKSDRGYKAIALNTLGISLYFVPAYLVVDGLADLHVFKTIKKRVDSLKKRISKD